EERCRRYRTFPTCPTSQKPSFGPLLHGIQSAGQALLLVVVARPLPEMRPADAGRNMFADQPARGVLALDIVDDDILRDDDVSLHADHFGDVRDAAGAVAKTGGLDDDVD